MAFATTVAPAAAAGAPLRFEYRADPSCPPSDRFETAVRSRVDRESDATISLAVARHDDAFEGELEIERAGATVARRTLSGRSCDEVVDALALIAALALSEAAASAPPLDPVAARAAPPPTVPTLATSTAIDEPLRFAVGTMAGAYQGFSPGASFGGEAFGELGRGMLSAWHARIGIAVATGATAIDGGTARFVAVTGNATVCVLRVRVAESMTLAPCVRFDAGVLRARGSGVGMTLTSDQPWLAPSLLARFGVRVTGRIELDAETGVTVPLERERFFFPPDTTVYDVPAAAMVVRVGVAATL
jgi:hypothetical protein